MDGQLYWQGLEKPKADPDINLGLDQRPIGGPAIHLV